MSKEDMIQFIEAYLRQVTSDPKEKKYLRKGFHLDDLSSDQVAIK